MRINFRKITSALASAAMVSSTVAIAAAASFPAPFVKDGQADVAVVYGSGASLDLAAVTDISVSLQAALTSQGGGGSSGGSTPEGGDFVQLDKSSDKLNLGNALNGPFGSTVDDDDLEVLLADGIYRADDNDEFDYEQKITLGSPTFTHFRDSDYEDLVGLDERTPVLGFQISTNTLVLNYSIDFLSPAESDVSSGDLEDIEGSDLPIFGRNYYVSDAKNGTDANYFGTFTLLDSANTGIVAESETVTVNVGTKSYEVFISFIDSDEVVFDVNGERTNSLSEGQTFKLTDGAYIGVRDILSQDYAGGIKKAEFSIGSGKVEIQSGNDIKINDETFSGVKSWVVRGTASGSTQKVSKIIVEWISDDEEFLTAANELSMPVFGNVKFTMNEFVRPEEEKITIAGDSDTNVQVTWPFEDGSKSFNILYSNSTGELEGIGKSATERLATSSTNRLVYREQFGSDNYHRYFVATYNTTNDAESYLLSAKITEDTGDNRNETTLKNEITGQEYGPYTLSDEITIGDVTVTIQEIGRNSTDRWLNLTAGSNVNFNTVFSKGGVKAWLPFEAGNSSTVNGAVNFTSSGDGILNGTTTGHNFDSWWFFFSEEDKDDNKASGNAFNFTVNDNSDGDLHITEVSGTGSGGPNGLEVGDSSGVYEAYIRSDVATMTKQYTKPDRDWVEVFYPTGSDGDSESYAEVFLAEASATSGSGGDLGSVTVTDDEIEQVSSKNLIVVGGSCINTVAGRLLGSSTPLCGADWEAATGVGSGSNLVQTFQSPFASSKVATLVAGYDVSDTRNAAKFLTTESVTTDAGTKYVDGEMMA